MSLLKETELLMSLLSNLLDICRSPWQLQRPTKVLSVLCTQKLTVWTEGCRDRERQGLKEEGPVQMERRGASTWKRYPLFFRGMSFWHLVEAWSSGWHNRCIVLGHRVCGNLLQFYTIYNWLDKEDQGILDSHCHSSTAYYNRKNPFTAFS